MAKIPYVGLTDTLNTHRTRFNQLIDSVGDLALLNTDDSDTIVNAINSVDSNVGTRLSLTTTNKTDLVSAINEHDAELGTITVSAMKATKATSTTVSAHFAEIQDSIGRGPLTLTYKQLIPAINELDSNAGRKSNLTTTSKTNIVSAINEHDAELGTITAAAMKSRLGASTVSTVVAEIHDSIGAGGLNTTNKTLIGAINEHDAELGTISAAAMKSRLGASTVSTVIAEIHDSIGAGGLTTTTKTLVGAINEHDTELGTITASAMKAKSGAATVSAALAGLSDSIGAGNLNTTTKTLVGAINEHDAELGTISSAAMKTKLGASTVSAAVAELNDSIGYGVLTTTYKQLIPAINELDSNAGRKSSLTTTAKTSIVAGINEHDAELGTITAAAMKSRLGASTVSAVVAEIHDSIGAGGLNTTTKTLIGAINEHDTELGTITVAAMKATKTTSTTISAAIAELHDSIGLGVLTTTYKQLIPAINELDSNAGRKANLNTTAKTSLVAGINELDTRLDVVETHIVDSGASQLVLKSAGSTAAKFTGANVVFQGTVQPVSGLSTIQQDFKGAIDELKTRVDALDSTQANILDSAFSAIGTLASLQTAIKTDVVSAINDLYDSVPVMARSGFSAGTSLTYDAQAGQYSVTSSGITATQLASNAVTTAKISNSNVTLAKIANATTAKRVIASTAAGAAYSEQQVDSDMLGADAVATAKIQNSAVTTAKLADLNVTTGKLADTAVTTAKITDLNVTTGKLANNAVTYAKMQTSTLANRLIGATSAGVQLSEVQVNSSMIAAGAVDSAALKANVVVLGAKTTGNYVATLTQGTGVTVSGGTGAGSTPTISIGQAVSTSSNVTFNDVIVSGNLTVSGTTTTINTETVNIADNIIVLNSNYTGGTPTENGGIEIERGTQVNVGLIWNETTDRWAFTNDGTTYHNIPTSTEYIDSATSKFPTTYAWTGGTTAGPTGSLTGTNLTAISFPAIPSAGASASGVVTTGTQTFAGAKTFSNDLTTNGALITAGSISSTSWTTSGIAFRSSSATFTDTSSAAASTIATRTINSLGAGTLASTNAITVTNASTLYIADDPAAGTNTTITNPHAIHVAVGRTYLAPAGSLSVPTLAIRDVNTGLYSSASGTLNVVAGGTLAGAFTSTGFDGSYLQAGTVAAAKLASSTSLIIYNSAGTAVKTLYGAGA